MHRRNQVSHKSTGDQSLSRKSKRSESLLSLYCGRDDQPATRRKRQAKSVPDFTVWREEERQISDLIWSQQVWSVALMSGQTSHQPGRLEYETGMNLLVLSAPCRSCISCRRCHIPSNAMLNTSGDELDVSSARLALASADQPWLKLASAGTAVMSSPLLPGWDRGRRPHRSVMPHACMPVCNSTVVLAQLHPVICNQ